jgi:hypothetical protein
MTARGQLLPAAMNQEDADSPHLTGDARNPGWVYG